MRPLFHPSPDDITLENIFHALSDPVRLDILMDLARAECPKICNAYAGSCDHPLAKSTLSLHFKVLREAGLIRSERVGVTMQNRIRSDDLTKKFGPLLDTIMAAYLTTHKPKPRNKRKGRTS